MEQWLVIPLSFGLLSSLHCAGMCGSIVGALSLSLPPDFQTSPWRLGSYLLAYNLGRIGSYALAGMVAAFFGQGVAMELAPQIGPAILRGLSGTVLIVTGLYLGGWLPRLVLVETLGTPLWRLLEPVARRLIPARNLGQAVIFGMIWGWFPCFLVYSALVWSATAPTPLLGAATMVAFGLGTLPLVTAMGAMGRWIVQLSRRTWLRPMAALILIMIGALGLFWTPAHRHPEEERPSHPPPGPSMDHHHQPASGPPP